LPFSNTAQLTILELIGFGRDMERFARIACASFATPPVATPGAVIVDAIQGLLW